MCNRDGLFAMVALALGAVALAGVLLTDAYNDGAQHDARGYDALSRALAADAAAPAGATLLASAGELGQ